MNNIILVISSLWYFKGVELVFARLPSQKRSFQGSDPLLKSCVSNRTCTCTLAKNRQCLRVLICSTIEIGHYVVSSNGMFLILFEIFLLRPSQFLRNKTVWQTFVFSNYAFVTTVSVLFLIFASLLLFCFLFVCLFVCFQSKVFSL